MASLSIEHYDFEGLLSECRNAGLLAALRSRPLPPLDSELLLPASGEPYSRKVLFGGELGEVLLVRWAGDVFCAPHDHGDAEAFVCLLEGQLEELRWSFSSGELRMQSRQSVQAPALVTQAARVIHCMKGSAGALALHCYLPAIANMRLYDTAARRTLVVREEHGAWLPVEPRAILAVQSW